MENQNHKSVNNKNFFLRVFDVIDIPLFLYLGWSLISVFIQKQNFYLDYYIYFAIFGLVLAIFFPGFAGFRATKDKFANIKPWIAGLSLSLLVSIFSLSLGIVNLIYFSDSLSEDLSSSFIDTNADSDYIDESAQIEDVQTQNNLDFSEEDFSNKLLLWTIIGGAISIVFTSIFGALFGLIGGAIGKD